MRAAGEVDDPEKARNLLASVEVPRRKSRRAPVDAGGGSSAALSASAGFPEAAAAAPPVSSVLLGSLDRCNLGAGVLADLGRALGDDYLAVVDANWSRTWVGWQSLVEYVCSQAWQGDEGYLDAVVPHVANVVKRFLMVAAQNSGVPGSDEERLRALSASGFRRGVGLTFGLNDCCADSLLQLLMAGGVLRPSITVEERRVACASFREYLLLDADEHVRPRDLRGQVCPEVHPSRINQCLWKPIVESQTFCLTTER